MHSELNADSYNVEADVMYIVTIVLKGLNGKSSYFWIQVRDKLEYTKYFIVSLETVWIKKQMFL
jgi:hypothetical protein